MHNSKMMPYQMEREEEKRESTLHAASSLKIEKWNKQITYNVSTLCEIDSAGA